MILVWVASVDRRTGFNPGGSSSDLQGSSVRISLTTSIWRFPPNLLSDTQCQTVWFRTPARPELQATQCCQHFTNAFGHDLPRSFLFWPILYKFRVFQLYLSLKFKVLRPLNNRVSSRNPLGRLSELTVDPAFKWFHSNDSNANCCTSR